MNTQRLRRTAKVGATATVCGVVMAGGLVACGKASTKQQVGSAKDNLLSANSASFTLHFDDPNNEFASTAKTADDKKTAGILKDSTLSITVDPDGDKTLGDVSKASASPSQDPAAALKSGGAVDVTYAYKGKTVFAIREISGTLYAKLDPTGYQNVAGEPLPLDELDKSAAQVPGASPAVQGIKDGKWLSLDLASIYTKAKKAGLLDEFEKQTSSASSIDPKVAQDLGNKMYAAVKGHTTYTTSKNGDTVVLSVKVDAKAALTAAVDVLKDPEFAQLMKSSGSEVDKQLEAAKTAIAKLPAGSIDGTITSKDEHLTQMSLDLGSVAALSKDADAKKIKTAKLVVDVNDKAAAVSNPSSDQVVQVDSLADALLQQFTQAKSQMSARPGQLKVPATS